MRSGLSVFQLTILPQTDPLPGLPYLFCAATRTRQLGPCLRVPEPRPATMSRAKPAGVPAAIDGLSMRWGRFLLSQVQGRPLRDQLPAAQRSPNRHNRGDQQYGEYVRRQPRYSKLVRSDQPGCGNLAGRWPLVSALPVAAGRAD